MKPNSIQTKQQLEKRSNRLAVYVVAVGNIYNIPSMADTMKIKVGTGSTNHWQTIQDIVGQKWGGSGAIVKQVKTANRAKCDIGIGVDYPY